MITTIDGVEKKVGDVIWYLAYKKSQGYYPATGKLTMGDEVMIDTQNMQKNFYDDHNLCAEQCNLMNQDSLKQK